MKELNVPIDSAGRIVLPKNVRRELAIEPGDTLTLSIHGSSVTLTPNKDATGFVRKGHALVFATSGDETLSDETVRRLLEGTRAKRDDELLGKSRESKRRA